MRIIGIELDNQLILSRDKDGQIKAKMETYLHSHDGTNPQKIIEALAVLGECYSYDGNVVKTKTYYLKAIEVIRRLNDSSLLGKCYLRLGKALRLCEAHSEAAIYVNMSLEIAEENSAGDQIADCLNILADIYRALGNGEAERSYLRLAFSNPLIDPVDKGFFGERLALSLAEVKDYTKATYFYEKALSLLEREGFYRFWNDRIRKLADIYFISGKNRQSKETANRKIQ